MEAESGADAVGLESIQGGWSEGRAGCGGGASTRINAGAVDARVYDRVTDGRGSDLQKDVEEGEQEAEEGAAEV